MRLKRIAHLAFDTHPSTLVKVCIHLKLLFCDHVDSWTLMSVMVWRSLHRPKPLRRYLSGTCISATQPQHTSTFLRSIPKIADILSTPPTIDPQSITVTGSIRTIRNQKYRSFLELGDGSTSHSLQAVLQPSQAAGYDLVRS